MIDKLILNGYGEGNASARGWYNCSGEGEGSSTSEGVGGAFDEPHDGFGDGSGRGLAFGYTLLDGDCFNPGL